MYLGLVALYSGRAGDARRRLTEAVALFAETRDLLGQTLGLAFLGDATVPVSAEAAESFYLQSLALQLDGSDPWASSIPLTALGRLAISRRDWTTARRWLEASVEARRQSGASRLLPISLLTLAEAEREDGDFHRSQTLAAEAFERAKSSRDIPTLAWAECHLGWLAAESGDLPLAARYLGPAIRRSLEVGQPARTASCLLAVAIVARRSAQSADAEALIRHAATLATDVAQWLPCEQRLLAEALDSGIDHPGHGLKPGVAIARRVLGRVALSAL
jgi:hypothetical protein